MSTTTAPAAAEAPAAPKEKILMEMKPMVIPTILNLENMVIIGFVVISVISAAVFRFGLYEIIIIAALFLLLAVPSFRGIFAAGSTTYVLTNRRVVIFTVGFGQKERSIPLDRIASVTCKSSGLQKLYGAGEIVIKQKGLRGSTKLFGLNDCRARAKRIQQAVQKFQAN